MLCLNRKRLPCKLLNALYRSYCDDNLIDFVTPFAKSSEACVWSCLYPKHIEKSSLRFPQQLRSYASSPHQPILNKLKDGLGGFTVPKIGSIPALDSLSLRASNLWQEYQHAFFITVGALATIGIWFALQTITGLAVDTSLPFVQLINLGISAVAVLLSFAFLHSYHTISPKAVFREAMKQLSSSAAVQEVLGAPIVGSPVMLTSVWEGGFYFRDMRLRHRSPRVLMAFEVEGPQRKGLVKLEAKKRKGCHVFKLLAFELRNNNQSKTGSSMVGAVARVFLHGSESVHDKGSGSVLNSMSQPYLETLELDKKFEAGDDDDEVKEKLSIIHTAVVGGVIHSAPSSAVQQAAGGCAELLKPEKSPSGWVSLWVNKLLRSLRQAAGGTLQTSK